MLLWFQNSIRYRGYRSIRDFLGAIIKAPVQQHRAFGATVLLNLSFTAGPFAIAF
jgi:hypothetical protein